MRKIFVLILLFVSVLCNAQTTDSIAGIRFHDMTLADALVMARDSGKMVFVDCYTKTCVPCRYMAQNIFVLPECGQYFNPRFVSIMKDVEEGDGPQIAQEFDVRLYPTYLIITPNGKLVGQQIGAIKDAGKFCERIGQIIDLAAMRDVFEHGKFNTDFIFRYFKMLKEVEPQSLVPTIEKMLLPWTVDQLCLPETWQWVASEIRNPESPLFRRMVNERADFAKYLGEEYYAKHMVMLYSEDLRANRYMEVDFGLRIADLEMLEKDSLYKEALPVRLRIQEHVLALEKRKEALRQRAANKQQ